MPGFEDLKVWQLARNFRNRISILVAKFPTEEKYGLSSQIKRSSRSVTANIAEGYGRFHYQENIQFCRQARGSLEESKDHLYTALDENLISKTEFEEIVSSYTECAKPLNGYIEWLKNQKEKTNQKRVS